MLLLSLLKRGMDCMMNICFENSVTERYLYHFMTISFMVTNESKAQYLERTRTWSLGENNR